MLTQPEKSLQEMTAAELDALRQVWKGEAQDLFTPFIPALLAGYRMSYRQERTRMFGSIIVDNIQIDTNDTVKLYSPSKDAFLHRLNIQVFIGKEQVANLVLLYYPNIDGSGEWLDDKYLFARPYSLDWTGIVQELIREFQVYNQSEQVQAEEYARQSLLKLLTKGEYKA